MAVVARAPIDGLSVICDADEEGGGSKRGGGVGGRDEEDGGEKAREGRRRRCCPCPVKWVVILERKLFIAVILSSIVGYISDLSSDVLLAARYYHNGDIWSVEMELEIMFIEGLQL